MAAKRVKVWLRTTPPKPSWTAFKHYERGRLWLFDDHAEFRPKQGEPLALRPLLKVSRGWSNFLSGNRIVSLADTWVEVQFGDSESPRVVYLNDARWFGCVSLFMRSRSILTGLRRFVQP